MDISLKLRGGSRSLAPICEEKPQYRRHLLQRKECSDETEATVSETEFEEEDEPCSSSAEEEYYCKRHNLGAVGDDDETHPYDECTMFEEYTIEECTIDDGGNLTCADDYTFVTIEEEKTVRFSATTTVTYIMPLSEFSRKEKTNYWMSAKEKEKYERRLARTLAKLLAQETAGVFSKGGEDGNVGFPSSTHRGLENFTVQGNSKVCKQISLILNSVMDEQDRQWTEGSEGVEENEYQIAAISQRLSQQDTIHAIQKAQNDEEEAIGVYTKGSFYRDYRNAFVGDNDNDESESADNINNKTTLSCRVRAAKKAAKKQRRSSSATTGSSKEADQN